MTISTAATNLPEASVIHCVLCDGTSAEPCATIDRRPEGEVDYGIPPGRYRREIMRCDRCHVYFNHHGLLPETFYGGVYNDAAYGSRFRARFDAIMALPPERSDNKQRVARLDAFLARPGVVRSGIRVLDIGSGLGVFAAEMLGRGYEVHVVDPDPRAVEHAREVVGVHGATRGALGAMPEPRPFDMVTLNKVLEHVADPLPALGSAKAFMAPQGVIYVELPDGEAAAAEGFVDRSEFFVEHFTAYGPKSLQWLLSHAGLEILESGRVHEPSGKYSIFAIAGLPDG
jgi:2-polyprenyl-3-methyl-5-hydroxy-6-metoxy-1,4-benzoquinol methylase